MGIGTLDGGEFFQVGLENSLYKKIVNANLKRKKKKKKIPIVISTISHFWSPTQKTFAILEIVVKFNFYY